MYVSSVYVNQEFERHESEYAPNTEIEKKSLTGYTIFLLCGMLYPILYEIIQITNAGFNKYFSQFEKYPNLVYIWCSIAMQIVHTIETPYPTWSKILSMVVILFAIRRTFSFLRIF